MQSRSPIVVMKYIINTYPNVLRNPETVPSEYNDTTSPRWRKLLAADDEDEAAAATAEEATAATAAAAEDWCPPDNIIFLLKWSIFLLLLNAISLHRP